MAQPFQFELVSPERLLLSDKVLEVTVPGSEGEFGVLKDHSPFMATMRPGLLKVRTGEGKLVEYFVRGGFADVSTSGLTVLAEQAIPVTELKADVIAQQVQDAREDVADARDDEARTKAEATLAQLIEIQTALKAA
ncbi:F0F1 ATP synthase subunit epsilon [Pannonibacter sp. Q-1]|jgi:F-type H+-transporting ATPase subunit epsilon|uniref:ATP synthase epsilon chain n=2 Tax=Pannonibacter TaxID=227873 RepID=A0A0L0IXS5_9HYPH|nr:MULTISPECIES: F0F1 ATP synthase subunit epsilon [Pannonibacter]ALV26635.1 ATP synthase F0F1 subunit epsilon [Pannonibacter phragmitetus]KND18301.1 ATP synthase F0F1 subunit epsilon [Pannonibacter phragmitetus]MBA4206243.1 F0F1 ATP synthase subunit epsilon [Polymorphum sp.]CUA92791.1 ATP synthase F1 subcomplex epsilon subunit [Pannonibacter indicus]